MRKYEITFGTEVAGDGTLLDRTDERLEEIRHNLAVTFGGYTETRHRGGYLHRDGRLVEEESITFSIAGDDDKEDTIKGVAVVLKQAFQQESVLVVSYPITGEFI